MVISEIGGGGSRRRCAPGWDPAHSCLAGAALSQPMEVGVGIALGACGGLWTLGIPLFVIVFLTNRGR